MILMTMCRAVPMFGSLQQQTCHRHDHHQQQRKKIFLSDNVCTEDPTKSENPCQIFEKSSQRARRLCRHSQIPRLTSLALVVVLLPAVWQAHHHASVAPSWEALQKLALLPLSVLRQALRPVAPPALLFSESPAA